MAKWRIFTNDREPKLYSCFAEKVEAKSAADAVKKCGALDLPESGYKLRVIASPEDSPELWPTSNEGKKK